LSLLLYARIEEMDLNPVLPYRDGWIAVDAGIIFSKSE